MYKSTMAFNYLSGVVIIIVGAVIPAVMSTTISPDPKIFFKDRIGTNLTEITWVHACNSKAKLNETLANDKIMMIEADVVIGTILNGTNETMPIMAHPPSNASDLSLKEFLKEVLADGKRGIKLDFKTIDVFKSSLPILKEVREKMTIPLWINADILDGPVDTTTKPVDADSFLSGVSENFHESILSVGWTTKYGVIPNGMTVGNYTQQEIQKMIDTLSKNNITQTVTYPVRACMAANTYSLWVELLNKTVKNNPTLTIWSNDDDGVDAGKLSKVIRDIGVDKVYVDVPDKLWKELHISAAADKLPGVFMVIAIIAINFILSIF